MNSLRIGEGKSVLVSDYKCETSSPPTYTTTKWLFNESKHIAVLNGAFKTKSLDPLIHTQANSYVGVEFGPISVNPTQPRQSWDGMMVTDDEADVVLKDLWLHHASTGCLIHSSATISRCWIDSCQIGIHINQGRLTANRDTIRDCGTGIVAQKLSWSETVGLLVLVDSCQILRCATEGIRLPVLGIHPVERRRQIVIRQSEIKFNRGHGIWTQYSDAIIRNCNISSNGWLSGMVLDSIPPPVIGNAGLFIYPEGSTAYVHGTDFQSNVGAGTHVIGGELEGRGLRTDYDELDLRGWNCYHNNHVSVKAEVNGQARMGHYDFISNQFRNDRNSFRYPRWKHPQIQKYINIEARGAGPVQAEHNFWSPSVDSWLLWGQSNPVYGGYPIFSADSVRCGEGVSINGPTNGTSGSEQSRNLLRLVNCDSLRAAWEYIKSTLTDNLDQSDATIYAWALQKIRLNSDIDSAQIVLEQKAYNGSKSALSTHSLLNLRPIYVILDDSTMAWRLYDSLLAKLPDDNIPDSTITAELYRTDLLWLINQDTTSAASLISSLWAEYPDEMRVRTMYVCITQDTTAYWHGFEDGMEKSPLPERAIRPNEIEILGSHPNPFNPTTTIRYYCSSSASITLRVYSADGRLVDSRDLGLRESGVHYLQYSAEHLPSGVYMAVLDNGSQSANIKLVVQK